MQLILNYSKKTDKALSYVLEKLPSKISSKINDFLKEKNISTVNEIRIKSSSFISLLINHSIIKTDIFVTSDIINEIFLSLCSGSIYAHISTIKDGYISVGKGVRAGICGKASLEQEKIDGVYDITSINIRIPQRITFAGNYLFELLKAENFKASVLIFSAPGEGKTTILRDFLEKLSKFTSIRHAVIDSREEITPFIDEIITSDVFIGYPKGLAIELATKSMTPQIIICDEITSIKEAEAINLSVSSGVNLIATTHAGSFEELKRRDVISPLLKNMVFDYALGIKRNSHNKFVYELNKLK